MPYITLIMTFVCLSLGLTACDKELSYSQLLKNPAMLKKELTRCQNTEGQTQAPTQRCIIVSKAAITLLSLIKQMEKNPESFGQKVLNQEAECVKAKIKLQEAEKNIQALKKTNASKESLTEAEQKKKEAETFYWQQREQVKILLAVLGLTSPE